MKKLKPQMTCYCKWCKDIGLKAPAAYISDSRDQRETACESHKANLIAMDESRRKLDQHHTEADQQTWMKL